MTERRKARPRDPLQLAKLIGDIATGQVEDRASQDPFTPAQEFARLGGLKGGRARAEKLSSEQKKKIAQNAANNRWSKERPK